MRLYLLFICLLVGISTTYGQDWCNPTQRPAGVGEGGFKINGPATGCALFDVTVEKTVGESALYIYDYKGGDPTKAPYSPSSATTYRYTKPGVYKILQLISNGTGSVACQTVEVFAAPNFTVKACSGRKVQVTIPDDSTTKRYDEFTIDWGNSFKSPGLKGTVTSYSTYSTGINAVTIKVFGSVRGQSLGCSKDTSVVLNTTNLSAVAIRKVTTRSDGTVDVLIKGSQGATAEVQIDEGSGTYKNTGLLMTSNDTTTISIKNIDANKNTYCFRLSANDGCDNAATLSNEVCSINLDVVAQDRQNNLTWKEYPKAAPFQSYKITRNSANLGTAISNRAATSNTDRNVICGEQYCYQVTATLTGGAESVSPLRCVKAISSETPSVVRNAFVSVLEDEQKIELRADLPTVGTTPKYKTIFLRAENGSTDFKEIAIKDNTLTFLDENAIPTAQSYCYKIQYENACGNRSEPTDPMCSIRLYSKTNSTVDWTAESPFLTPVNRYELEVLDEQGGLVAQVPLGGNTSFNPDVYNPDQQLFRYRILAFAQGTPRISYSNFYIFTRDAIVFIPDAFSPNGDNINDTFAAKGQFLDKSRLIVYNRWGQVLYETDNALQGWDGNVNNQPAAEGTYVYRVEITDSMGKGFVKTGTLLLAR